MAVREPGGVLKMSEILTNIGYHPPITEPITSPLSECCPYCGIRGTGGAVCPDCQTILDGVKGGSK